MSTKTTTTSDRASRAQKRARNGVSFSIDLSDFAGLEPINSPNLVVENDSVDQVHEKATHPEMTEESDSEMPHHPFSDFMRDRARTMSIDIDKLTAGLLDLSDLPHGDDDDGGDLPPLLWNAILSRSRTNSLADPRFRTNSVVSQETWRSAEGLLNETTSSEEKVKTGVHVTFAGLSLPEKSTGGLADALQADPKDRSFSFDFFSFGNATAECPPTEGKKRERVESVSFMLPPAKSSRPRGDSIIFDPTSFSDGGIHEQHALQMSADLLSSDEADDLLEEPTVDLAESSSDLQELSEVVDDSADVDDSDDLSEESPDDKPHDLRPTVKAAPGRPRKSAGLKKSATGVGILPTRPSGVSDTTIPVPSCVTSGIEFTMEILNKDGRIGIYLPEERKVRLELFHSKRKMRVWRKKIKYDVRKKFADSRPRVKGRFIKK